MALPKLDLPKHKHFLVGLNETITYRGFTAKEQKILLEAKERDDESSIRSAIKQIIELCVYDDIDVDNLAFFDIEDIFIRIRAKSVGDTVDLKYKVKESDPEEFVEFTVNLDEVKVKIDNDHTKKIILSGDNEKIIGVMMKYPSLSMIDSKLDIFDMIKLSIDYIFDEDEMYYIKDTSKQDLDDFVDSLDTRAIGKLKQFFESIPRLKHTQIVKLKNGNKVTLNLEGLKDFFM